MGIFDKISPKVEEKGACIAGGIRVGVSRAQGSRQLRRLEKGRKGYRAIRAIVHTSLNICLMIIEG